MNIISNQFSFSLRMIRPWIPIDWSKLACHDAGCHVESFLFCWKIQIQTQVQMVMQMQTQMKISISKLIQAQTKAQVKRWCHVAGCHFWSFLFWRQKQIWIQSQLRTQTTNSNPDMRDSGLWRLSIRQNAHLNLNTNLLNTNLRKNNKWTKINKAAVLQGKARIRLGPNKKYKYKYLVSISLSRSIPVPPPLSAAITPSLGICNIPSPHNKHNNICIQYLRYSIFNIYHLWYSTFNICNIPSPHNKHNNMPSVSIHFITAIYSIS